MSTEHNFYDGRFVASASQQRIRVFNPATGLEINSVPSATLDEASEAVAAAKRAQAGWRALPAIERGNALRRLADTLLAWSDRIGVALAAESGKSLADATSEVIYGVELLRYHAEWARRVEGEVIESDNPDEMLVLRREPMGVVACLIPFNYPIYTLVRKIAPALITGNTVVVRPSNNTPVSALVFAQAVQEADMPAGIINILTMEHDVAGRLCTHPAISMITLTGSVAAGQVVLDYCKANIAKPSLELGGKTPVIVEPDTDLEAIASMIVAAKTSHCGQVCTSPERLYVHRDVHDALLALLKKTFKERAFGDRAIDPTAMGPLANKAAQLRIHAMVARARTEGAVVETGGYLPAGDGFFYPPTLISGCRQTMEIVREETFGPVLAVQSYASFEEALALASDHQFGLSSVLFTENYRKAMHAAASIEAGELYVNRFPADPYQGFHAGWKKSGLGGDDGKHGMLEFTQTRLVIMKY